MAQIHGGQLGAWRRPKSLTSRVGRVSPVSADVPVHAKLPIIHCDPPHKQPIISDNGFKASPLQSTDKAISYPPSCLSLFQRIRTSTVPQWASQMSLIVNCTAESGWQKVLVGLRHVFAARENMENTMEQNRTHRLAVLASGSWAFAFIQISINFKTDPVCRYHTSEVSCADAVEGKYLPTSNYLPPTLPCPWLSEDKLGHKCRPRRTLCSYTFSRNRKEAAMRLTLYNLLDSKSHRMNIPLQV